MVNDTPLKQFKLGTDLIDIKCNNGLQLVIRYQDKLPLCVKFEHIHKLMERGLAFLLFAREHQPSELTVDGLKDSYTIGQPINFTINFKGNSLGCTYPTVFVTASDGMIAWLNYMPVMLCDSDDKVMYRELKWPIGNGELTINDMWDSYRLVVNWNDKVLTKEFGINSRISSVTIPRGFAELKSTFVPQNMTVKIGINDTVRWTNEDNSENLISSDNADEFAFYDETHFGLPLRSLLGSGQSFDYSFLTPGEFGYHSKTRQHGTIKVLPADRPKMQLQIQHPSPPLEHDYSNDRVAVTRGTWVSWDNIDNVTHTITS